jgi:hypothetical protein
MVDHHKKTKLNILNEFILVEMVILGLLILNEMKNDFLFTERKKIEQRTEIR